MNTPHEILVDQAIDLITAEYKQAESRFGRFAGAHEGYAVILEELDELWTEVKGNNVKLAIQEAVQVSAMALRFIADVADKYGVDLHDLYKPADG